MVLAREPALLEFLNPRKHLSAGIGWAVFTVIALAAPLCAWLVAIETENYIRRGAIQSLQQNSVQIHREIASNLQSRLSIIHLAATQLSQLTLSTADLRTALDSIRDQYPELNWIGLVGKDGVVIAAADNVFVGDSVLNSSWFANGSKGPYLGDVRNAPSLEQLLPRGGSGNLFRVLDIAAPVFDQEGATIAVLGAHLSWNWVRNLQALSLSGIDSNTSELQLILASEDNTVLTGPSDLITQTMPVSTELSEQGKYLVGVHRSAYADSVTLDWTVAVRSESARAISAAHSAQRAVFLTIIGAAAVAALLIVYAVSRLTRNLRMLSRDAEMIASGLKQELEPMDGRDDVSQIGRVLATSIGNLQQEKKTLQTLNAELDQRVEDRTKDIERLSTESREIALTQQRLRFARDMHDTLAHSMMAALTQIRLIRKTRNRLSEDEVEEELGRAEDVALNGLAEARAAILQIRADNVQDKGISSALHALVERFRVRTGRNFTLRIDPNSIHQEEKRAETVYRIVEESLRNIEKHANANEIEITLERTELPGSEKHPVPAFKLQVTDDGKGFNTEQVASGHYGLIGLREQAALIDGELTIESSPGSGTAISLTYRAYLS